MSHSADPSIAANQAPPTESQSESTEDPIVIIGGGLVGLTLALALMKWSIPVIVYERDKEPDSKERGGWAITIHWALEALRKCLPPSYFDYLTNIQVDLDQAMKDTGNFMFLNLETLVPKYQIPPSKRMRLNRATFRYILRQEVDVRWQKRLVSFDAPEKGKVTVHFDDGTSASSHLVIGCDGARSKVRQLLFSQDPDVAQLHTLPVRAMGVTTRLTFDQVQPLFRIDPLLFQGCHPETGVFLWFSTVSTPVLNRSSETGNPYFEGQLILSWLHKTKSDGIPDGNAQRLAKMRELTTGFAPQLREVIANLPQDTQVQAIALADWPAKKWPNFDSRITLAGDAAHAMTMYRGEAYNHGVTDASLLATQLHFVKIGEKTQELALEEYEAEVLARTHDAVLLSRQACLDAHDYHNLKSDSPLVSKRARILVPATEE